jgi:ADP-ribose pyrophosphatase YjhB (NUDIX family)
MENDTEAMDLLNPIINVKALCVIYRNDEILVFEGRNEQKDETYYRPLGGHIEFGELSEVAVRREFCEEVGSEIENLRFLHVFENIFNLEGIPGHEIVFLYEGDLADKAVYDLSDFFILEEIGPPIRALWKPLSGFRNGRPPLYPDGLLELLQERDANF